MSTDWRVTWNRRYLDRVAIVRPQPEPSRRRLTDEEIQVLPEHLRAMAYLSRATNDAVEGLGRRIAEAWVPALKEIPRDLP